jgi:F0F1-type ATP synthase assembly protein I
VTSSTRGRRGGGILATAGGQALRILLWQAVCVGVLAIAAAIAWQPRIGAGVLVGGAIGMVPTVYIALALFRNAMSGGAHVGMHSVFVGWMIKNALTIALLVIAFRSRAFAAPALLGGLGTALFAYWLCMVFGQVKHATSADGK